MTNKTRVGMMEKEKKAITSFVFKADPRVFRLLSIRSLPTFLKTSQTRAIRMIILMFNNPKKKIEVTKGNVFEI